MEQNITHIAQSLKTSIEQNTASGAKELIEFAKTYASDKKLRHQALILKLNYTMDGDAGQAAVISEMQQLVDQIIADHQSHAEDDFAAKTNAALEKLTAHYLKKSPPNAVIFECQGLGKTYQKTGFSLKDINLQLREGEITSIVGENGNGKTTLFRLIAGELRHDQGAMSFPNLVKKVSSNIQWTEVKTQMAYVPQELPPWYGSLKQNLQFEAAIHGIKGKDNHREVNFIVQRLGLQDELNKEWKELSGGYKLRFALARALVWKPRLLIIDEPLANLDFKTQQIILSDMRNMADSLRYPMSILISSQHLHEIEPVTDHILFLKQGEVAFLGKKNELGVERKYNTFELGTDLKIAELKQKLAGEQINKLYHNGISYVITTPLEVSDRDLIQLLIRHDISFHYFRNISQSIKQLFGE